MVSYGTKIVDDVDIQYINTILSVCNSRLTNVFARFVNFLVQNHDWETYLAYSKYSKLFLDEIFILKFEFHCFIFKILCHES